MSETRINVNNNNNNNNNFLKSQNYEIGSGDWHKLVTSIRRASFIKLIKNYIKIIKHY